MKILLAEINSALNQALLEKREHKVAPASNVTLALALWLKLHFDAIVVNLSDSDVAGFKLIAALRKREKERGGRIRSVAIGELGEEERALSSGFDVFLEFPPSGIELWESVEKSLPEASEDGSDAAIKPSFNQQAAMRLVDNDEELFLEIVEMFRADVVDYRDKLQESLKGSDPELVEKFAHTLKGASANICAGPLKDASSDIELAARDGDLASARKYFLSFDQEFRRLTSDLEVFGSLN
jgi:two-component system, sensor histidine kinase and response regulator